MCVENCGRGGNGICATDDPNNLSARSTRLQDSSRGRGIAVRRLIVLFVIIVPFVLSNNLMARVWRVRADGGGQAPTIQAAIDSCANGDTVLAASGSYEGEGNHDIDFKGKAIVVRSEHGRDSTYVSAYALIGSKGFIFRSGEDSSSVVEGFRIHCDGTAVECVGSSPVIRGNYLRAFYGPVVALTNTSSRILDNSLQPDCGDNIRCVSDSSLFAGNTVRAGSGGVPAPVRCLDSCVRIIGNDVRSPIVCDGGSCEISDNRLYVYQNYAAVAAAPEASAAAAEPSSHPRAETGMSFSTAASASTARSYASASGYTAAVSCSSCSALIADNYVKSAFVECDSSIVTIRGNTFQYSAKLSMSLTRGTYDVEGNTITETVDIAAGMFGTGIECSYLDSTTTIGGNRIVDNSRTDYFVGIACTDASPTIMNNIIARNGYMNDGGAGIACVRSSPTIVGNTIAANKTAAGVDCSDRSNPILERNLIVRNFGVGVNAADLTSAPLLSCCDVFGNGSGDYMGISDQAGLDGNISVDPIFCDLESSKYEIHALSPCAPGHHPEGANCGLIGAGGIGCDYVATLLREYRATVEAAAIRVAWSVSEAGRGMEFFVLRAEMPGGDYEEMSARGGEEIRAVSAPAGSPSFEFVDGTCASGASYRYRVDVSDELGRRVLFETAPVSVAPLRLALDQNCPNPFNPTTAITYTVPAREHVSLEIYDARGARVAVLASGDEERGVRTVRWNGTDGRGRPAASGVYFCRLTAGKETISRKMVLMR